MKNSKTVSFRVPENVISEIEKEAKSNMISTNVLINQILHDYVEFYRHRKRLLPTPEDSIKHVLEKITDSEIKELTDISFNSIRDWALVSKMRFDLGACLDAIEQYCRIGEIGFEYSTVGGSYSFVIRHELGKIFSLFISGLIEKIFWELKKVKTDSEITPTTVLIKTRSRID